VINFVSLKNTETLGFKLISLLTLFIFPLVQIELKTIFDIVNSLQPKKKKSPIVQESLYLPLKDFVKTFKEFLMRMSETYRRTFGEEYYKNAAHIDFEQFGVNKKEFLEECVQDRISSDLAVAAQIENILASLKDVN